MKNKNMKLNLSDTQLKEHLAKQIKFLQKSAKEYDAGDIDEAVRLASSIRVLLYDNRYPSLLAQLRKKGIYFYDISHDYDSRMVPFAGLIMLRMGWGRTLAAPPIAQCIPFLDDGPPSLCINRKIPFDDWWNKIVMVDVNRKIQTRKDLVLQAANIEGGAHVGKYAKEAYYDVTRLNSLNLRVKKIFINGGEIIQIQECCFKGPELASIRQITHEVLKSLRDEYPELLSDSK